MSAGRLGACALGGALLVALAWWLLADDAPRADERVRATPGPAEAARAEPALPVALAPRDVAAPTPALATPASAAPESLAPDALEIRVRHASGEPAVGGILALYRTPEVLLAHGVLDDEGRYRHAGFDGFVHAVVVGVSARPAELRLADGHGEHLLELDEGAALSGRVLVNGAAPDGPIPVGVHGISRRQDLPCRGELVPVLTMPGTPGAVGHLLTDAHGRFRVSGFEPGARVGVWGPGGPYELLVEQSTEAPVTLPFEGYELALRRRAVVRGRVVHRDGRPAREAELSMVARITRGPAPVDGLRAVQAQRRLDAVRMDGDARFAVDVLGDVDILCHDVASRRALEPDACGPPVADVELEVTHPDGTRAAMILDALDPRVDHDVGDIVLREPNMITLRVRDERGRPIAGARAHPEGRDPARNDAALVADETGTVCFLRDLAKHHIVTVFAEGYDLEWVDLREHPKRATIDVTLRACSSLLLEVAWSANEQRLGDLFWYAELSGAAPLYQDRHGAQQRGVPARVGPHALRAQRTIRREGDTLFVDIFASGSDMRLDGLRSHHPLRLRLHAPAAALPGEDDTLWTSDTIWLEPGEQRVVRVDLGHVELQR